jgi:hypothetical protein
MDVMQVDTFLQQTVCLDLETDENGKLYAIGAVAGDRILSRRDCGI